MTPERNWWIMKMRQYLLVRSNVEMKAKTDTGTMQGSLFRLSHSQLSTQDGEKF